QRPIRSHLRLGRHPRATLPRRTARRGLSAVLPAEQRYGGGGKRARDLDVLRVSERDVAVDVLVEQIAGVAMTSRVELLRAVSSHPDEIRRPDLVPVLTEQIEAMPFEHVETVLHDMGLDRRKANAGFEP